MACFPGGSHDSGRRMGWSKVVESAGYPEEIGARIRSGGPIRDLGFVPGDFLGGSPPEKHSCLAGFFLFLNPGRGSLAVWNVSARDLRFVAQNGLISSFQ